MSKVRLSGTVNGASDPNREIRARLLYLLFAGGWNIYNSNGDQRITLSNIEEKIQESDAFIFTPNPSLEDLFSAVSIFVGYQTLDSNLNGKATIILNSDSSWKGLFDLLGSLHKLGTIKQNYQDFLLETITPESVVEKLEQVKRNGMPDIGREKIASAQTESFDTPLPKNHAGNICVFCSASIKDNDYLNDGYTLGQQIAENNMGCVSGAGTTGIMGAVVRGSVDAGGWTGGSNVTHIIELEGLPDGLSSFWLRPDIYTRMEVMIENSDAFVIFPGGAGTVQEMLTLLIFKQSGNSLMENKPIVIFNRKTNLKGVRFWNKLIDLLQPWNDKKLFQIVNELDEIIPTVQANLPQD